MPPAMPRPSPAGLTVLCLLHVGPLHPYGMQRLIKTWGKDEVVNVGQRANLYKTIRRLHEAGLIAVRQTERAQQYPERTVYELTDEGRRTGLRWLAGMLASPRTEYPAITFTVSSLTPADEGASVSGTLTVREQSRPITFPASVSRLDDGAIALDATLQIDRSEFGLTWNQLGMASMKNTITIHAVFTKS